MSEREARKALKEGIERSLRELLAEDTLEDSGRRQLALSRRVASAEQFIRIYLQEMLPKFVIDCAINAATADRSPLGAPETAPCTLCRHVAAAHYSVERRGGGYFIGCFECQPNHAEHFEITPKS